MSAPSDREAVRVRARVEGTVQGVGFRPHVQRLASELGLAGFVLNDGRGVLVEAEGGSRAVDELLRRVRAEAPPLARVRGLEVEPIPATGGSGFRIAPSPAGAVATVAVAPDAATCEECLAELLDPADRRFRYPFISCTACGPRFTIVRAVPYDRCRTTMASFEMCEACAAEYADPADRRFDAQANACAACGPRTILVDQAGLAVDLGEARDPVEAAAQAIAAGRIVAVKGIGGYHLACRADDPDAVAELRARKHRECRPFALMAADLQAARTLVSLDARAERALRSSRRPIVVAPRVTGEGTAPGVAPGAAELGVMLPYSPVHHLLLADAGVTMVMTSGNLSDEPIAHRDDEALRRLSAIADLFLLGDRPIRTRADDSVVRARGAGHPLLIRRSRGYVPESIPLPIEGPPLLAMGAELKNTFCLASGGRAWVSHHIGDLRGYEALLSFREGIDRFRRLLGISPVAVAHDLHPDYLSTREAEAIDGVRLLAVQHHHAHFAAVLAEHGLTEPAVGAIFDGAGLGGDGTVWGGEVLAGDLASFTRAASLLPTPLPGGDAAAREPWRMACSWLARTLGERCPAPPPALRGAVETSEWERVAKLAASGTASPATTSAGRLFDCVAALCGLTARVDYEGQAAVELEWLADDRERAAYPMPVAEREDGDDAPVVLDARETIAAIVRDLAADVPRALVAARFHNGLAASTAAVCAEAAERASTRTVVLGGGVFQNALLLARTAAALEARRMRVLIPRLLPPNDGGVSYGQAAVAAARSGRAG